MIIDYKYLSVVTALIAAALSGFLLVYPDFIYWLFTIEGNESADFMSRRASLLFVGLALLSWMSRHSPHSSARQAICLNLSVTMFGLAILGCVEFLRGFAGAGIFIAVITELCLAFAYFSFWLQHRVSANTELEKGANV